ncbi:hypothetical protein EMIHUDRAFT_466197 [Emiliania huxleyi CCMP1516]|uniref:Response regulatory domain-containing protein n=3 Tax=Emiliania huxleyi TaxID=2903 RepID=A0A0D3HZY9_EMIH1|nr:hypothetical protein EMIHUDRAFT_466197 [Emiliania huxleyi CCMP1516]EOD04574.1 hypothetical protein EMIHUDRAFT_466197 [Emiliania huxleyi CCMP1516]|eukprot:XP_005757003.1 hypothetical protein EMIHUDRAFT_466197 [Emiliania huxleyi CCMP1516]
MQRSINDTHRRMHAPDPPAPEAATATAHPPESPPSSSALPPAEEDTAGGFERLRILVVEDEDFAARVVQALCEKCSYEVTIARSAEAALDFLAADAARPATEQFNLILVDIVMAPGRMSGKELLLALRVERVERCVVMMSAIHQRAMVEECIRSGAESYLVKPIRLEDVARLWQVVMRHHFAALSRRQARQQAEMERLRAETLAERERVRRERLELEQKVLLAGQRERMQQQMMRMLPSQMRQYWQLAQTCNDLILHASRQGVFLYMSHKCKRLFGYAPTELSSSRDNRRRAREETPLVAEGEKLPLRVRPKDGAFVPLRFPMYPVAEPGEVRSVIGALPRLHSLAGKSRPRAPLTDESQSEDGEAPVSLSSSQSEASLSSSHPAESPSPPSLPARSEWAASPAQGGPQAGPGQEQRSASLSRLLAAAFSTISEELGEEGAAAGGEGANGGEGVSGGEGAGGDAGEGGGSTADGGGEGGAEAFGKAKPPFSPSLPRGDAAPRRAEEAPPQAGRVRDSAPRVAPAAQFLDFATVVDSGSEPWAEGGDFPADPTEAARMVAARAFESAEGAAAAIAAAASAAADGGEGARAAGRGGEGGRGEGGEGGEGGGLGAGAGGVAEGGSESERRLAALRQELVLSTEASHFTPLGAAVYRVPADPSGVLAALRLPSTRVGEGSQCGWPPLHLALLRGESHLPALQLLPAVVQLLLASRCDVVSGPPRVRHWSSDAAAGRICRKLLDCRADPCARARDGSMPHAAAAVARNSATAALLMAAAQQRAKEALVASPWSQRLDSDAAVFSEPQPYRGRATRRGGGGKNRAAKEAAAAAAAEEAAAVAAVGRGECTTGSTATVATSPPLSTSTSSVGFGSASSLPAKSDDAVPPPAALAGLEQVAGLTALVDRLPEAAQQKALAWCSENEVHEVGLIAAAGIADAFVAALGIKPTGVPALLLRQRLKRD